MKHILPLTLALAIPAFGGTTAYVAPAPSPEPSMIQWFIGGSYGQFNTDGSSTYDGTDITVGDVSDLDFDTVAAWEDPDYTGDTGDYTLGDYVNDQQFNVNDEDPLFDAIAGIDPRFANGLSYRTDISDVDLDMGSIHFGRNIGGMGGFDLAAFLEVGWLTGDFTATGILTNGNLLVPTELVLFSQNFDVDVIPVTVNLKAERNLFGSVGGYFSAGLGYAFTNISASGFDENGGGFYAQAAAGLVWYATESVDIYGGARWVHLSDVDFDDAGLGFELDDTIGWEIGARYKF